MPAPDVLPPLIVPLIVTERLHLRFLRTQDAAPFARITTDPANGPLLPLQPAPGTRADADRLLERIRAAYESADPEIIYAVTAANADDAGIGLAIVAPHDEADDARLGAVFLLPDARGRSFGREAARAMTSLAFAELRARYVDAFARQGDEAARTTAAHLGYKPLRPAYDRGAKIHRFRAHEPPGGRPPKRRRR